MHEDFYELGERLFGAILLAPGRLGHQLNILCLAMEQGRWPLLWRDLHGPPPLELKGPEPPAPAPGPHGRQGNESFEEQDPEAAFGLVVLVSNQTASETIHVGLLEPSFTSVLEGKGHVSEPKQGCERASRIEFKLENE